YLLSRQLVERHDFRVGIPARETDDEVVMDERRAGKAVVPCPCLPFHAEIRNKVFLPEDRARGDVKSPELAVRAEHVDAVAVDRRRCAWAIRVEHAGVAGRPLMSPENLARLFVKGDGALDPFQTPCFLEVEDEHPAVGDRGTRVTHADGGAP